MFMSFLYPLNYIFAYYNEQTLIYYPHQFFRARSIILKNLVFSLHFLICRQEVFLPILQIKY